MLPAGARSLAGNFDGALTAELDVLAKAAEAGCQIVDLELESAEEARATQLGQFRAGLQAAGTALLISSHDFSRTRSLEGLEQTAQRIEVFRAGLCEGGFHGAVAGGQPSGFAAD